jgi:SAM-dependent methyltransferase
MQHTWVASLPSIRRIGRDDSRIESAEENPAKTTLTTTAYWDADRGERFDPWVVNSSPYSEVLERVLPRRSDWTCAEIGAYPGGILCDLAKRFGYKPVAIEYSAHTDRIQRMFEHNGLSGIVENRDFLGIQESAVYDVVCSFGFVEHFADPREVVARHLRLTKPGGYVVLSVPRIDGFQGALYEATYLPDEWDRIRTSHNPRAMNLDTLKRFASIAGDEIVFADYLFGASTEPCAPPLRAPSTVPTRSSSCDAGTHRFRKTSATSRNTPGRKAIWTPAASTTDPAVSPRVWRRINAGWRPG